MKRFTVRTDGACRGNPGPGAGGAVIEHEGEVVFTGGVRLGNTTNNVAEYEGLLYGLAKAKELGGDAVDIRSDSELLVRQLQGRYKVKSPKLKPLHRRATEALKAFSEYTVSHVGREDNSAADGVANDVLDGKHEG